MRVWDEISPFIEIVDAELGERGGEQAHLLRSDHCPGFRDLRRGARGCRGARSRLGRHHRCHQRGRWRRFGDHPDFAGPHRPVGDTPGEIAQEKVGNPEPGGYLVSRCSWVDVADVLLARARELEVPAVFDTLDFKLLDRQHGVGGQLLSIQGQAARYDGDSSCRCSVPTRRRTPPWPWPRWKRSSAVLGAARAERRSGPRRLCRR